MEYVAAYIMRTISIIICMSWAHGYIKDIVKQDIHVKLTVDHKMGGTGYANEINLKLK